MAKKRTMAEELAASALQTMREAMESQDPTMMQAGLDTLRFLSEESDDFDLLDMDIDDL